MLYVQIKKMFYMQITGGSKGIGLALAIESASQGSHVTIIARNRVNVK